MDLSRIYLAVSNKTYLMDTLGKHGMNGIAISINMLQIYNL